MNKSKRAKSQKTKTKNDQEQDKISQHFSAMGKKSWDKRKQDLLNSSK